VSKHTYSPTKTAKLNDFSLFLLTCNSASLVAVHLKLNFPKLFKLQAFRKYAVNRRHHNRACFSKLMSKKKMNDKCLVPDFVNSKSCYVVKLVLFNRTVILRLH